MHIRYPVTPSATYRLRSSLRFLATLFALSLLPAATVQSAVIITGELPPTLQRRWPMAASWQARCSSPSKRQATRI